MLPDDTIDDITVSDNGDIIKVIATIIQIIIVFTAWQPNITVAFRGNTLKRMILHERTLKRYYEEFSSEFRISVLVPDGNRYKEVPFGNNLIEEYWAFFVKRKV